MATERDFEKEGPELATKLRVAEDQAYTFLLDYVRSVAPKLHCQHSAKTLLEILDNATITRADTHTLLAGGMIIANDDACYKLRADELKEHVSDVMWAVLRDLLARPKLNKEPPFWW